MKEELMFLGFISLLLITASSVISNICLPSKFDNSAFAPSIKSEVDENRENKDLKERILLMAFALQKRVLNTFNQNTCGKYGGIIGAFNCQGAGWDSKERRIKGYSHCYKTMTGSVHVNDIEWDQLNEASQMGKAEEYIVYLNQAEKLFLTTPNSDTIPMTIEPSSFEIFNFVPIKKLSPIAKFAPVGLTNMFNSGGTIQDFQYEDGANCAKVEIKGGGIFLAYSNVLPNKCYLNGDEVKFEWTSGNGKLTINIPWIEEANGISNVKLVYVPARCAEMILKARI